MTSADGETFPILNPSPHGAVQLRDQECAKIFYNECTDNSIGMLTTFKVNYKTGCST